MTASPKIPKAPSQVPQQRVHGVVDLPPKPKSFRGGASYEDMPDEFIPKRRVPRSPVYLAQVEWALAPYFCGVLAFYVQRRRSVWLLWTRRLDDYANPWRWDWEPVAWCDRRGVTLREAAVHMLIELWRFDPGIESGFQFAWINEEALLSIDDLMAIRRLVQCELEGAE